MNLRLPRIMRGILVFAILPQSSIYADTPLREKERRTDTIEAGVAPPSTMGYLALLPYMEEGFRKGTLLKLETSPLSKIVKKMIEDGEYERVSLWALTSSGWDDSSVKRRIAASKELFEGVLVRPMRKDELDLLSFHFDTAMTWLSVDGLLLKRSLDDELATITSGVNLAKSYGLTKSGRDSAKSLSLPVFEEWERAKTPSSPWITTISVVVVALSSILVAVMRGWDDSFGRRSPSSNTLFWTLSALSFFAAWIVAAAVPSISLWQPSITTGLAALAIFLTCTLLARLSGFETCIRASRRHLVAAAVFLVPTVGLLLAFSVQPLIFGGILTLVSAYALPQVPPAIPRPAAPPLPNRKTVLLTSVLLIFWVTSVTAFSLLAPDMVASHLDPSFQSHEFAPTPVGLASFAGLFFIPLIAPLAMLVIHYWKVKKNVNVDCRLGSFPRIGSGEIILLASCVAFSLLASFPSMLRGGKDSNESFSPGATWTEALYAAESGTGVIVDARPPGSQPEIKSFANLDPESNSEAIKAFCEFVGGKKVYVFCASASCGISRELAQRINSFCPEGAAHIEGGAEEWLEK